MKRDDFGLYSGYGLFIDGQWRRAATGEERKVIGPTSEEAIASAEMPFGGVKHSGMGRAGGTLGVRDDLEAKYIKTRL